jgi:hypothetical protein
LRDTFFRLVDHALVHDGQELARAFDLDGIDAEDVVVGSRHGPEHAGQGALHSVGEFRNRADL